VGVVVSTMATRARADVSFALSWRTDPRGDHCIDEEALRGAVEQRLGRKPFTDAARADILIEGEESALGHGQFRARVTERDGRGAVRGVRELEAQSCSALHRAATLIVALMIDAHGAGERADEESSTTPAPPPELQAPPHAGVVSVAPEPSSPTLTPARRQPSLRTPERRSPRLQFSLGLGLGTSVGVLPSASATVLLVARLEPEGSRWSFDSWVGYSFPQRVSDGPVRGDFAAVEQRMRPCFALGRWRSRRIDACAGVEWAAVLPETIGVARGSDHWRVLIGPTAAVAFEQRAGTFGGRVELGLTLGVPQYDFSYFDLAGERKSFYSTDAALFFVALGGLARIL